MKRSTRLLALLAAGVTLVALPPLGERRASAVGKDRVVRCRQPKTCWPTAFAFAPDGTQIFYVERFSGEIRRFTVDVEQDVRWSKIKDVAGSGEQGVLGIALDPDWALGPDHQWVYVYYTEAHPERNLIVRLRKKEGGKGVQRQKLASIPATTYHDGGVIHFGPDGMLYAVTGDAGRPSRAQKRANLAGKVLRLEPNGDRPADNPIGGSKAFSFGHRNSFGFAFDPMTDRIWQSENGPTCDDEINLVLPGENYGWGGASDCPDTNESGPSPQEPKLKFNPLIAPTGAAFCDGCGLGSGVEGDLLVGSYLDDVIRNLTLNPARDEITDTSVLLNNPRAVLAVEAAPDGRLFFSDARGIYRIRA